MFHTRFTALLICSGLALAGCATVTTGTQQSFEVQVQGTDTAHCQVTRSDIAPLAVTPGTPVFIHRSDLPLQVQCEKPGFERATLEVAARIQNRAKYELPFGMFVDYLSGARYEYPAQVTLTLTPLVATASLR